MGTFVVSKRKDDHFQFNLKATNGQVILTSQGYTTKGACMDGIASVKNHAATDSNFEWNCSIDNRPYFNLKASNGQVIGTSQMYESDAACENGIESVMANAPDAEIVDETA